MKLFIKALFEVAKSWKPFEKPTVTGRMDK